MIRRLLIGPWADDRWAFRAVGEGRRVPRRVAIIWRLGYWAKVWWPEQLCRLVGHAPDDWLYKDEAYCRRCGLCLGPPAEERRT